VARCTRCSGEIDEEGFCVGCGHRFQGSAATAQPPAEPPQPPERPTPPEPAAESWESVVDDAGLARLPDFDQSEPESRPDDVPEWHRRCGNCEWPIGQSGYDQPALLSGFCPNCGKPYSFAPRLDKGHTLGHYEIVRPIAHGGVGWVYLAMDTHLDNRYVAIKGLINESPATIAASVNERKFLITFDHEHIVRILDVVIDPGAETSTGYLVMEFIEGQRLDRIHQQAPLEANVVRYGLQILDALEYMHGRGYVYCDLKPDNAIRQRKRIKMIDLGAVCPIDFRGEVWGTEQFLVPREERDSRGMQVDMDLYSLGKTLRHLLSPEGADPTENRSQPAPARESTPLELVLDRAAATDWTRRFATAADLREQLEWVLRQLAAAEGTRLAPRQSTRFAGPAELLDDGLGRLPELDSWTGEPAGAAALRAGPVDDGRPVSPEVAVRLPSTVPDRSDPATAFLAGATTADPRRLLTELDAYHRPSVEIELARCRANLLLRDYPAALRALEKAGREAGRHDWRVSWHAALLALHERRIADATRLFTSVHRALPGELVPRLALGYCAEHSGAVEVAQQHYAVVWQTDRAEVSAAFGLARTRLAGGHRTEAVRSLDEVRPVSRHYDAARIAAIRILAGRLDATPPRAEHVAGAARRLESGATEMRLVTVVRQAALELVLDQDDPSDLPPGAVLGQQVTEDGLRLRLEHSFRELAGQSADDDQHGTLIDLANTVRPRTRW
jgi:serine/threonine-protein kinase PknG